MNYLIHAQPTWTFGDDELSKSDYETMNSLQQFRRAGVRSFKFQGTGNVLINTQVPAGVPPPYQSRSSGAQLEPLR